MESLAVGTKIELQRQTEQLKKVDQNLGKVNGEVEVAKHTMHEIERKRKVNRLIVYGVCAVVALGILLIVYSKVVPTSSSS